jgi:hypothetical protein
MTGSSPVTETIAMLLHPTLETLAQLRLDGMLKALQEQLEMPEI